MEDGQVRALATDAGVGSEGAADVGDGVGCTAGKAGLVTTLEC